MELGRIDLPKYFRTQFWNDLIDILEHYHVENKNSISSANLPIWIYKEVVKKDVMSKIKTKIKQYIKKAMKNEIEKLWNAHSESIIDPCPKIKHPKKVITNLIHSLFTKFQSVFTQTSKSVYSSRDKVTEVDAFMSERYLSIWNMIKGLMNKDIFDKYFVEIEVEICANILIKIAEKNDEIGRENEKLNDIYYRQIDSIRRTLMIMLSR
ncbi:unnamed protein product [Blepharisma stoltei]|uniref:Uncharacterized protein n=1 Tax=Blepharisma stoltei TaxID=1481888 RepID=A0AAU9IM92_9CILI|nr:unnamed protein product [Blepharisma stoltei]